MSEEKEEESKKGTLKEAKRWCHCDIHGIDYPCAEGCPKCK